MIVIGLTGGIGMGKTTVASQFRLLGVPALDSDRVVHRLLAQDAQAIRAVAAQFPAALKDGAIDRAALGREVFGKPEKLKELEFILHPLVRRAQEAFIRRERSRGRRAVVLDIPLLFETGAEKRCDVTVLATAPDFLQAQRVMRRPGMTAEKLAHIRLRQMPDAEKRRRADYMVLTGLGKRHSLRQVRRILGEIMSHAVSASPHFSFFFKILPVSSKNSG
jgi:dephospho-CoA kinase